MTRHRFFVAGPVTEGASGTLDVGQSRQVTSVLRLGQGEHIVVFDGSGVEGNARISDLGKRSTAFEITDIHYPEREPDIELTIGLALLRGDRFELAAQKLTELGVRRIVPLEAERCVVTFRDARDWEKRAARLRRIIVEAMEQSERTIDVDLDAPVSPARFFEAQPTIVLTEREVGPPIATIPLESRMSLAIGPEGGWSDAERDLIERIAIPASLGKLILRAETAAIVSAATIIQRRISAS